MNTQLMQNKFNTKMTAEMCMVTNLTKIGSFLAEQIYKYIFLWYCAHPVFLAWQINLHGYCGTHIII